MTGHGDRILKSVENLAHICEAFTRTENEMAF